MHFITVCLLKVAFRTGFVPVDKLGLTKLMQVILTGAGACGSCRGDEVTSTIFSARLG
jgi:hypothetical protein